MRSPLRIRASNKVIDFSIGDQAVRNQESSVPAIPVANLVSVDGSSGTARNCADQGAFLATDQAAENGSTKCAPRSGDFVSVLIPNGTILAIPIVVVAVGIIAVNVIAISVITISSVAIPGVVVTAIVSAVSATIRRRSI